MMGENFIRPKGKPIITGRNLLWHRVFLCPVRKKCSNTQEREEIVKINHVSKFFPVISVD